MIIWIDIETTGLDPSKDQILELAMIPTDGHGRPLGEPFCQVLHFEGPIENDYVREMHAKSGLAGRLRDPNLPDVSETEQLAMGYMKSLGDVKFCVAGRNPEFDTGFLRSHMPSLAKKLGYKTIDILTFERAFKEAGLVFPGEPTKTHRALDDLIDDIEIYQSFLARF